MSIGPPIPELQLFQNLTLKIQVKVMAKVKFDGYIWGLEFNWYVFASWQSTIILLKYNKFHLNLKIQGQGHKENQPKSNQVI